MQTTLSTRNETEFFTNVYSTFDGRSIERKRLGEEEQQEQLIGDR